MTQVWMLRQIVPHQIALVFDAVTFHFVPIFPGQAEILRYLIVFYYLHIAVDLPVDLPVLYHNSAFTSTL